MYYIGYGWLTLVYIRTYGVENRAVRSNMLYELGLGKRYFRTTATVIGQTRELDGLDGAKLG
jgi:hypothetical protein